MISRRSKSPAAKRGSLTEKYMNNWYFTFGSNHRDQYGMSLGDFYVKISANSWNEARDRMFQVRDSLWSSQYDEKVFLPQIEKYGLKEIDLYDSK